MEKTQWIELGSCPLTLEDIRDVAFDKKKVKLSDVAVERIHVARKFLLAKIKTDAVIYGINTGFGLLSNVRVPSEDLEQLQYNILRSHACGMGPALADHYVRAMLLLRASTLSVGHSGVSKELIEHILAILNAGIVPVVPEQGSVGASGDLAPLSHLALVLIGEGLARFPSKKGAQEISGAEALKLAGLEPIRLGPKDGLALINGTQFMAALGSLNLLEAERLCDVADMAGAMSLEATRGTVVAFDPLIHQVRPHPGQIQVAKNLCGLLLTNGKLSEISVSHANCEKVQDPYSFRCMPQVHGATRDVLTYVRGVLEREINSVTDNPLVFPEDGKIMSGGNFHGQAVAMAMDFLAIAVAELANISDQRMQKLVNPAFSDLPAFLTVKGGLNSGFMIIQVTTAAIVSENKTLCHPASVDSVPTSADKEDHVSMGAWAAKKASQVITNTRRVLSLELLAGAQGIDLLRPLKSSASLEKLHAIIRKRIDKVDADRAFYEDFKALDEIVRSDEIGGLIHE